MTDRIDGQAEPGRDEIEALLPWYATGRLGDADRETVRRVLDSDPDLARQLEAIERERAAVAAFNGEISAPTERAWRRVRAEIRSRQAAPEAVPSRAPASPSLVSRLLDSLRDLFVAPSPMVLRYAGAAAAVVIVVQAVGIGFLIEGGPAPSPTYQTATGPGTAPVAEGPLLLIAFEDDVSVADLTALLSEAELRLVDGPRAGGLYVVRVDRPDIGVDDLGPLIDELGRRPGVRFAGRFE